jgi:RES domain-containing protein
MAYAADSLALAALELFVHVGVDQAPEDLVAVQADVPVDSKTGGSAAWDWMKKLPNDWRYHSELSRQVGDEWARAKQSLAVLVPSVVVDVEWNILINPEHRDAQRLKVVQTRPFRFDKRMFRKNR